MLNDARIRKLIDYESSKDCFAGVNIAGGICYFLWDREHPGKCVISNVVGGKTNSLQRRLNEFPILIRSNMAISIVHKVLQTGLAPHSDFAYPRNPFGFQTNFRGKAKKETGDIEIVTSVGIQYIPRSSVIKNADIIDSTKAISSSDRPYFLYNFSSVQDSLKFSWGTNLKHSLVTFNDDIACRSKKRVNLQWRNFSKLTASSSVGNTPISKYVSVLIWPGPMIRVSVITL